MQYDISFANNEVGGVTVGPFTLTVPDGPAGQQAVAVNRGIREHIAGPLSVKMADTRHVQVVSVVSAGEGTAHYGSTTLGRFSIRPVP